MLGNPAIFAAAAFLACISSVDGASASSRPAAGAGEVRAVWEQSGKGLYPGDWPRTFRMLKANGVTDIFVNVGGIEFAHYASRILPRSMTARTMGDQLTACLAASRGTGIHVHAWLFCFNATRATPEQRSAFAKKGWCLKDPAGGTLTYLDPSNPDLRWTLLKAVDELARTYPVAGIHLDFVRWYERLAVAEATPAVVKRFRSEVKTPSIRALCGWRARKVATFLSAARTRIKAVNPSIWFTVAVLGKYPSCVDSVGQDWKSWLDAGLVDYIVPMNYTDDSSKYASFIAVQAHPKAHARRTISGIGVTANNLHLSARQVRWQVLSARKAGLAGVAFFDLDAELMKTLPFVVRP